MESPTILEDRRRVSLSCFPASYQTSNVSPSEITSETQKLSDYVVDLQSHSRDLFVISFP